MSPGGTDKNIRLGCSLYCKAGSLEFKHFTCQDTHKTNENVCDLCSKIFPYNVANLKRHKENTHFLKRDYQCDKCDKGQIMSECIYEIINFPKYHRKNLILPWKVL